MAAQNTPFKLRHLPSSAESIGPRVGAPVFFSPVNAEVPADGQAARPLVGVRRWRRDIFRAFNLDREPEPAGASPDNHDCARSDCQPLDLKSEAGLAGQLVADAGPLTALPPMAGQATDNAQHAALANTSPLPASSAFTVNAASAEWGSSGLSLGGIALGTTGTTAAMATRHGDNSLPVNTTEPLAPPIPPASPVAALADPVVASTPGAAGNLKIFDGDHDGKPDISGTGEAGGTITVTDPSGALHTAAIAADGSFSFELNYASALTGEYGFVVTDASGTSSPASTLEVTDLAAPDQPTLKVVDSDGDGMPDISGTAEAGSTVTITDPTGATWSAMAQADGTYALEIPAPLTLTGTYQASTADSWGNASLATSLNVTDLSAPSAPSLAVADTRGFGKPNITGSVEPGTTLTITDSAGQTWSTVGQANGTYELEIPVPDPLLGTYQVFTFDQYGNVSPTTTLNVTDLSAPPVPSLLVTDANGDGNPTISGTAEAGSTLTITDPTGATWSAAAQADGSYELEIPAPNPLEGIYQVIASDQAGNNSQPASVEVAALPALRGMPASALFEEDGAASFGSGAETTVASSIYSFIRDEAYSPAYGAEMAVGYSPAVLASQEIFG